MTQWYTVYFQLLPPLSHPGDKKKRGTGKFLYRKLGVTHGDTLAIIMYVLGFILIIRELQAAHSKVTQPWYADNAGAGGTFTLLQAHLDDILSQGPTRGYFPELIKSILVVSIHNVVWAQRLCHMRGLVIVTRSLYLGGYIGNVGPQSEWPGDKFQEWADGITTMMGVERKHLQAIRWPIEFPPIVVGLCAALHPGT